MKSPPQNNSSRRKKDLTDIIGHGAFVLRARMHAGGGSQQRINRNIVICNQ